MLSGPSGAGKSTAVKALEDLGFFCVDNLPVTLLPKFMELISQTEDITKVGVVIDVREREFLKEFPAIFSTVKKAGYKGEVVYLEASDRALIKRFSETRRRHPLPEALSPAEGVAKERELLNDIKASADSIVDTTGFNVHDLRRYLTDYFSSSAAGEKIIINVLSFGFRYGIPADADIVMDVRFLSNPYFVDELKGLTGRDRAVKEFVLSREETKTFIAKLKEFIDYLVPLYLKEGKSYLTIALGCTGGKHRSVVIAERFLEEVGSGPAGTYRAVHRDIDKV